MLVPRVPNKPKTIIHYKETIQCKQKIVSLKKSLTIMYKILNMKVQLLNPNLSCYI